MSSACTPRPCLTAPNGFKTAPKSTEISSKIGRMGPGWPPEAAGRRETPSMMMWLPTVSWAPRATRPWLAGASGPWPTQPPHSRHTAGAIRLAGPQESGPMVCIHEREQASWFALTRGAGSRIRGKKEERTRDVIGEDNKADEPPTAKDGPIGCQDRPNLPKRPP